MEDIYIYIFKYYLNFDFTGFSRFITKCAITPSLDKITGAWTMSHLKVGNLGVMIRGSYVGSRVLCGRGTS